MTERVVSETTLPSGATILEIQKPKMTLDFAASHTRYKNKAGDVVPGVTTVLRVIDKPQLLKWAWEQGRAGKDFETIRQSAADIGTVAHALIEAHIRQMELDRENIAPAMLSKAETSFLRWLDWWDREQLVPVHSELKMVSEDMQVGGTLDVLAHRKDGRVVLCDIKSSKAVYEEMLIQVAVYAAMYEEVTGQHVDECYIVRVGKEDADDLEVRTVNKREERVTAFHALTNARRLLQRAGLKL